MPTRELQAFLTVRAIPPKDMTRVDVRDTTELMKDLDLGVEHAQIIAMAGYSPTTEDDRALLREVFAWLKSIPGDFLLVDDDWSTVLERKGGEYTSDKPYVAALL